MRNIDKRSRISRRLIFYVILFSSLITLLTTLIQLYTEYTADVRELNQAVENVKTGYRSGITNAVWLDDKAQLHAILEGIGSLPDITYIEVQVKSVTYAAGGRRDEGHTISDSFPLLYEYGGKTLTIGETFIEASMTGINQRLVRRLWTLLTSNAVKTFFVAMFMYFIFERLVFRRLSQIFDFVEQHDIHKLNNRVNFSESTNKRHKDEISELADALDSMQGQISRSLQELLALKTTLDLSLEGVIMFHPDSCHIFYANSGTTKLIGYHVDELLSMTPFDIWSDLDESRFSELIHTVAEKGGGVLYLETVFRRKEGGTVPVKLVLQYLHPEGENPRFVLIAHDISVRKKAELLLRDSLEEAKASNEAKSKFMMSMSHELRTPLNAILGFGQLLQYNNKNLTEQQKESVTDILKSGEHLLNLIEDLLDLSRIETDNITLLFESVDPRSLIVECVNLISPMAALKDVRLENKISDLPLPVINIDSTRFKQVLINLLSNAVKYNRAGGLVTVACELRRHDTIRFIVADTGKGISEAQRNNVFTLFNRLGYEAGEIEGVGIGLNISKRLVEMMHGEINFDSTLGKGSRFWVDLPYRSGAVQGLGMDSSRSRQA